MFLIGLGSATKVYLGGVIALSELCTFILAPIVLIKNLPEFKRNKIMPAIYLPALMIVGCYISCEVNNVPLLFFIKNTMMFYSIIAAVVVFYYLLKQNFNSLGWFFVGNFFSSIISIYAFNPGVVIDGSGVEVIGMIDPESTINGVMFWYQKIFAIVKMPAFVNYLGVPLCLSIVPLVCAAAIVPFISVSGRSSTATLICSIILMSIGGKSRRRMAFLGRHFVCLLFIMAISAFCIKSAYVYAAKNGILSVEAQNKYEKQTQGNDSFMKILMGGRSEFFIAIRALLDSPIIGLGPYARDTKGYTQEFLAKYGTEKDLDDFYRRLRRFGIRGSELQLPRHSTLCQFWCDSGIIGLIFSLYYIYLVLMFFLKYSSVIPQWYGYFVIVIPPSLFAFFFNPYTDRFGYPLQIASLLIVRAVAERKIPVPYKHEVEACKYE